MNRVLIPSLLAVTILVAGIFAFIPIEEAKTVHTTIQANTLQFSVVTQAITNGDNFRVTCATGSTGCRILDAYLDDDDTNNDRLDAGAITLVVNGESIVLAADGANATNAATDVQALNGVSGVAMTESDTILFVMEGASDDYTLVVIAESEGDTEVTIAVEE